MADLSDRIEEVARQDASVDTDGLKTVGPNLKDVIAADEYLQRKAAAQTGGGLRFARFVFKSDYDRTNVT